MKQITWDDQWIGYDDAETVAMKKKWASGYCFGGTMVWSVDFDSGTGRSAGIRSHRQFVRYKTADCFLATLTIPIMTHP